MPFVAGAVWLGTSKGACSKSVSSSVTARTQKIQILFARSTFKRIHISRCNNLKYFWKAVTSRTKLLNITWEVVAYLIFFQKFQFDRYVITHFVVFLFMHLKQLLWLFNLWQSVCITRAKIQLFQVCSISIVFNPERKEKGRNTHLRAMSQNWPHI